MALPDYTTRACVIKKTKLAESDLILTLLVADGSQVRAVAKGARKPKSSFSATCELYNCAHVLVAHGKSLDILKEVRLVDARKNLHFDVVKSSAAACVAELTCAITQPELEHPRMFDLVNAAFAHIDSAPCDATCTLLVAAFCLKAFAFAGVAPELSHCVKCGEGVTGEFAPASDTFGKYKISSDTFGIFSFVEGGPICQNCQAGPHSVRMPKVVLEWARVLMFSTFDEIANFEAGSAPSAQLISICQQWCAFHIGKRLKSLNFLASLEQNCQ